MTDTNENIATTVSVMMETFISHFLKYAYYKNKWENARMTLM